MKRTEHLSDGRRFTCGAGVMALAASLGSPALAQTAIPTSPPPAAAANTADAQTEPTGSSVPPATDVASPDDIVVTAQKRGENLQRVPISIAAFSGPQLTNQGVFRLLDVQKAVPNFTASRGGQIANARLNIRGVGASTGQAAEPSVATFIDDFYVPRPGSVIGRFFDLEDLEVLRGPQGTLFGRNASVGALNIHSRLPGHELEGYINAEGASYGTAEVDGAINVPLTDNLAVRAAGLAQRFGGFAKSTFGNNRFGKLNTTAGRFTLKYDPTSDLSLVVRGEYTHNGGDGLNDNEIKSDTVTPAAAANFTARLGGVQPDFYTQFDHVVDYNTFGNLRDRQYAFNSDLKYSFGGGYTVRLLDSYRNWRDIQDEGDVGYAPAPLQLLPRHSYFTSGAQSHEVQFITPKRGLLDGHLDFVSGLYFFREVYGSGESFRFLDDTCSYIGGNISARLVTPCLAGARDPATSTIFNQTTRSLAGYAQATVTITDAFDLTLGGRYTDDLKTGNFTQLSPNPIAVFLRSPESAALRFHDGRFTYKVGASYHPDRNLLFFASYSTGFKSGGFNSGGGTPALGQARIFGSETTKDGEVGTKLTLAGGKALVNLTLFRMDIDNFQDRSFDGLTYRIRNAASLRQQGVEFDTVLRPVQGVRINAAVAYLDSKFLKYPNASALPALTGVQDLTGKPNTFSPHWQGAIGGEYESRLGASRWKLSGRGDVSFISDSNIGSVTDENPQSIQQGYALLSGQIKVTAPGDRLAFSIFGTNLTDRNYCTQIFAQPVDSLFGVRDRTTGGTLMRCVVGTPRVIGGRVGLKF